MIRTAWSDSESGGAYLRDISKDGISKATPDAFIGRGGETDVDRTEKEGYSCTVNVHEAFLGTLQDKNLILHLYFRLVLEGMITSMLEGNSIPSLMAPRLE
jgi:hypothetical protein